MNYLLDKKTKQKRLIKYLLAFFVLVILFYFRFGIFHGLSATAHTVFRPFLAAGNNLGGKFSSIGAYFSSKKSLTEENENLKSQINSLSTELADHNIVTDENNQLKEVLGRKKENANLILGSILSKPNQSPYDTIIIDVGEENGVQKGDMVFAFGNIPIGKVDILFGNSAKVILFSSPGEKTEVIMNNVFFEAIGRGGGNFEVSLPRDLVVQKETALTLPGSNSYVVAIVEEVISDPRDSFQKVMLVSPVNIQELKFVEVEI